MVPEEGLEPPRPCGHQFLRLACLPIPPHRHWCFRLVMIQLPSAFQTDALPNELQKRGGFKPVWLHAWADFYRNYPPR